MSTPHVASELELKLNYDSIPLSKRLQMVGTANMTRNSVQTEVNWGPEVNFVDASTGYTPLMAAAINGNASSVSTLIERGADLNYQEPKRGRTALLLACKAGKSEAVEVLLHRGAAVSITDRNGMTCLMWACKNGFMPCVVSLLARGAGINTFDNFDWTAVHYAAKHGHREIVDLLANSGAALQIREKLEEGKTPLMLAAQYGRRDTVNCLVDHGADINARTTKDDLTALMLASKEGHKGTVKALLDRGADANMSDAYGWTALHFAASWGRRETAVILIVEGGAQVDAMPRKRLSGGGGTTPLIVATKGQQIDVLAVLLEHGGNPAINDEATGRNIMAYAAAEGLTSVVRCLIDHSVDMNMRDTRGMTPLMLAVINGHAETIRLLLAACADINLMDTENKTALDHATETGTHRREMYLLAIVHSSAACKANVVAWLERDTSKMIRGSPAGGPAVFLNSLLYGADGLYAGLYQRPAEQDVLLMHNLAMLASACQKSIRSQPFDAHELRLKIAELDDMLLRCLECRAFASDEQLAHALLLQHFPEARLPGGQFDFRYFGAAFVSGPLALYLESGLLQLLGAPAIVRVTDQVFYASLRGPGVVNPATGYGSRSALLRARYCPAFMFVAEGLSRLLLLALLVAVLRAAPASRDSYLRSASDQTLLLVEQALMLHTALSVVYELGAMEEKGWATYPAVSIDPAELERSRYWNARLHMISSFWSCLDLCTLLPVLLWGLLKLSPLGDGVAQSVPPDTALGQMVLSLAAIPACLGLLRYPAVMVEPFGLMVLSVLSLTRSLFGFLVIFAVSGAGFGIALFGIFPSLPLLDSPQTVFRTLFDAINRNYDLGMFDGAPGFAQRSVGVAVLAVFVTWTAAVLLNTLAAHLVSTYPHTQAQAALQLQQLKARSLRQFLLVQEKSPLCMLPAPLNALPAALYVVHVIYTWRARLWTAGPGGGGAGSKGPGPGPGAAKCVSFAGSASDALLRALLLLPAAAAEYALAIADEPSALRRSQMLASAPLAVPACLAELAAKAFWRDASAVRLLVKSRLRDGRLRVQYGDSRDWTETIGVAERVEGKTYRFGGGKGKGRGGGGGGGGGGGRGGGGTMLLPGETLGADDGLVLAPTKAKAQPGSSSAGWGLGGKQISPLPLTDQAATAAAAATAYAATASKSGAAAGDQGFLWQAGLDGALARGLGQDQGEGGAGAEEEKFGDRPGTGAGLDAEGFVTGAATGPGLLQRQSSIVSLMSDASSGEELFLTLNRFPPAAAVDNTLQVAPSPGGLFRPHEKRAVFSQSLRDVFDDEARAEAAKNDPYALMLQLKAAVGLGLEEAAERTERQLRRLEALVLGQGLGDDEAGDGGGGGGGGAGRAGAGAGAGSPYYGTSSPLGGTGLRVGFQDSVSVAHVR